MSSIPSSSSSYRSSDMLALKRERERGRERGRGVEEEK